MTFERSATGKIGEEKAAEYLRKQGYAILDRNWKTRRAEIDIAAQKSGTLVVVEVRTTTTERYGTPEETLTWKKKRKLLLNSRAYALYRKHAGPVRIDAVCVVFAGSASNSPLRLTHYENILC
ncbi:MAG: YraN family protein [bacterium]|nr:YraN family protein [bacterium]